MTDCDCMAWVIIGYAAISVGVGLLVPILAAYDEYQKRKKH